MKPTYKILSLICLLIISTTLQAGKTGYEVELIIFEDATSRYINAEDWDYNDTLHNIKPIESKKNRADDPEYKKLNWDGAKLAKNLDKLKKNSNYRVLLHTRWKQTGLDRKNTFIIPVDTNKNTLNGSTLADADSSKTETNSTESYITGHIALVMSRYLHFNVNLKYFKYQQNNNEFKVYPVASERRMRSKEIHYMDHPMVGVIVLATPYKIESKTVKVKK